MHKEMLACVSHWLCIYVPDSLLFVLGCDNRVSVVSYGFTSNTLIIGLLHFPSLCCNAMPWFAGWSFGLTVNRYYYRILQRKFHRCPTWHCSSCNTGVLTERRQFLVSIWFRLLLSCLIMHLVRISIFNSVPTKTFWYACKNILAITMVMHAIMLLSGKQLLLVVIC